MRYLSLAVCVMALAPAPARAQASRETIDLTVDDAVTRALASSHRLDEATARQSASTAVVGERQALARPQVTTLAGYSRTNHVDEFGILLPNNQLRVIYPDVPDNYRARLDLQWPIYTGGRLDALADAASRESSAATSDVESVRADLRLDVTRAFWNLVVAEESARVVDESLARVGAHLRDVRNQLQAGLVPPNDVLSVQAQEARQRMLSIQAHANRDVAEADLARLAGVPVGTAIRPRAELAPVSVEQDVAGLVAQGLERRQDRRALTDRFAAAQAREAAAARGSRPTVALAGGVDYARPNPRIFPRQEAWKESWDAGVNVSWALFDGGRVRAETAEMAAGARAIQARIDELDSVLALDVRQRLAEIEASRAAFAAAESALAAATEARRVVGERFAAGVATSSDVLDAQVAVLQTGLDRTQAIASGHLAEARLRRTIGQ